MYLDLIIKMITIYYILLYQFVNVSLPLYCISLALVLCIRTFLYRVFIKYCVFSDFLEIFRTLAFLCFPSVSVCVHTPGR